MYIAEPIVSSFFPKSAVFEALSFCLALTRTALFPALPLQEAGPLAAFIQGPLSSPITVPGHPLPFPTEGAHSIRSFLTL